MSLVTKLRKNENLRKFIRMVNLEEHEGYLRREKRAAGVDCEYATPARLDGAETTDGEVGGRWLRLR